MYYKYTVDGYIITFGQFEAQPVGYTAIAEAAYTQIVDAFAARPTAPTGYDYRLRDGTLQWELYALPEPLTYTAEELAEMTNAEMEAVLYQYGISASLNKANLVRLVLAAQAEGGGGV